MGLADDPISAENPFQKKFFLKRRKDREKKEKREESKRKGKSQKRSQKNKQEEISALCNAPRRSQRQKEIQDRQEGISGNSTKRLHMRRGRRLSRTDKKLKKKVLRFDRKM